MKSSTISLLLLTTILLFGCKKEHVSSCNFATLVSTSHRSYAFDMILADHFVQTDRWESENATLTQANGKIELTANSSNTSQALEAWLTYTQQLPYAQSWEFSATVTVPLAWNTATGNSPQVGIGIFVGKPEASGQSKKVYECNLAVVGNGERFVQGQLIKNRLGGDPIRVDRKVLEKDKETIKMKLQYCADSHTIALLVDNTLVGTQGIDRKGKDNWGLSNSDKLDIGLMGFAENTVITDNSPSLTQFELLLY